MSTGRLARRVGHRQTVQHRQQHGSQRRCQQIGRSWPTPRVASLIIETDPRVKRVGRHRRASTDQHHWQHETQRRCQQIGSSSLILLAASRTLWTNQPARRVGHRQTRMKQHRHQHRWQYEMHRRNCQQSGSSSLIPQAVNLTFATSRLARRAGHRQIQLERCRQRWGSHNHCQQKIRTPQIGSSYLTLRAANPTIFNVRLARRVGARPPFHRMPLQMQHRHSAAVQFCWAVPQLCQRGGKS